MPITSPTATIAAEIRKISVIAPAKANRAAPTTCSDVPGASESMVWEKVATRSGLRRI